MATFLPAEAKGESPGRGRLEGRRILVVGAGQQDYGLESTPVGNGRAISVLAAREGASLALMDIDDRSLSATAELVANEGATSVELVGDASLEGDVRRIVTDAHRALGGLDGLVLAVGIGVPGGIDVTTAETWDKVFAVNVRSHFLFCKHVLPVLDSGSSIVFISSIAATRRIHNIASYHASKAALEGLKNVVALDAAANGSRANVLGLGYIDTAIGRWASSILPERREVVDRSGTIPLDRQGTAWEVAYGAVFLLSHEASYITGQSLFVDGGVSCASR